MTKIVCITGASKGIGLALARHFLNQGHYVIGTSRTGMIEKLSHQHLTVFSLDLADHQSMQAFGQLLSQKDLKIDILINNAGVGPDLDTQLPEAKTFQQTFEVNVTGTVFFTELLLPHLKPEGKIVNISSKMGSIDLCKLTDATAYRMSKATLNMYTKILSNRLGNAISVAAIHPGWVRTTLAKSNINGRLSPEASAQKLYDFIMSSYRTGTFWNIETDAEIAW